MSTTISRRSALRALGVGAAALTVGIDSAPGTARASDPVTPASLRTALGGKVLFPGDPDYDAERAVFNTIVEQHPRAIVVAESARDVQAAIAIGAGRLGWPIALQATGHGISTPADGALLINMRKMTGVVIDPAAGTARIQGGARWSDVLRASAPAALLPPVGSTSAVGATGYTTGGGLPIIGRTYGYAADRVRAIELVTPDGRRRRLTPHRERDLFWAVRGGGSNFGAVTSFEIDLLPTATLYGGTLTFPAAAAEAAFRAYIAWAAAVPDEMTSAATFVRLPSVPQVLQIQVVYVGTASDGAQVVAPLRALEPVSDTITEVPVAGVDSIFHVPDTPAPGVGASRLVRPLDSSGADLLENTVGFGATLPSGTVALRQLGGAFARCPQSPNPLGYRDASFLLFLNNPVPDPALLTTIEQAQQSAMSRLAPVLTAGTVPTFLGPFDTSPAMVSTGYAPEAWTRLLEIKHRYDPDNLFRINHNIR